MSTEVPPPYSRSAKTELSQRVLDSINGSQQQAFIEEIGTLNDDITFSIDLFEKMESLLIQEDAFKVNKKEDTLPFQAEKWQSTFEAYKKQIRVIKSAAANARNEAIIPFVSVWADMAEEDPDSDVLIEFEGFSEKLSKFAKPTVDFTDILDAIKAKRDLFDSKLTNAKAYEPTIEKLNKEIEELNVGLETATELAGLNGYSHKLTLILVTAPVAFIRSVKSMFTSADVEGTEKTVGEMEALWDAADAVEEYERKMKQKQKELEEQIILQARTKTNQGRWNVSISHLNELKVDSLEPKLSSICKIPEAIREDVDKYVAFLGSPDKDNQEKRNEAFADLALARTLYSLLGNALEAFATQ